MHFYEPMGDDKPRLLVTQSTASPSMNSQDDKISPRYSLAFWKVSKTWSNVSRPRYARLIDLGFGGQAMASLVIIPSVP